MNEVSFGTPPEDATPHIGQAVKEVSDNLTEFKLNDRTTVKVKELNGFETMLADKLGGGDLNTMPWNRSICAVRELNGRKFSSIRSAAEINERASLLSGREYDMLMKLYVENFMADEVPETLKNA